MIELLRQAAISGQSDGYDRTSLTGKNADMTVKPWVTAMVHRMMETWQL
jgi:hypothetical protein